MRVARAEGAAAQQAGPPGAEAADADYASERGSTDDEATLEEEDALAAADGANRKVRRVPEQDNPCTLVPMLRRPCGENDGPQKV